MLNHLHSDLLSAITSSQPKSNNSLVHPFMQEMAGTYSSFNRDNYKVRKVGLEDNAQRRKREAVQVVGTARFVCLFMI